MQPNELKEARKPYGSVKEFRTKFLLENWGMSNVEISRVWGCTAGNVSRFRSKCLESKEFANSV